MVLIAPDRLSFGQEKKKPSKFVTCNGVLIVNSYENFHLNETVFVVKRQKLMTSQLNENV